MPVFTIIFIAAVAAMLAVQLGLAQRHLGHVAANRTRIPEPFRDKIAAGAHSKAADYTMAKTQLHRLEAVYAVAVLIVWTIGGGLDALDRSWRALHIGPLLTGTGFILSVIFIGTLLDLPFALYRTFNIETRFGFNKMTPALYLVDVAKKLLLGIVIGVPLLLAVLWLMNKMGTRWWLYVWLLWTGFSVALLWAYPAFIAPLFNKFRPLESASLLERIHALLARTGFKSRGVFVMDGSRRSAHGNAYFTGLGRNKRIVFFDTLLGSLDEREIEAVLAHELGHFKRRHVVKRVLLSFALSLAGLALLGWLIQQPAFYRTFGVGTESAYMALTLFLMVGPVLGFWLQPLFAWSSRHDEYEADDYAAEQADADALMRALVKLYEDNASTLTPDPWHSAFYDSHPPALARIAHLQELTHTTA